jgi:hypothetical protein
MKTSVLGSIGDLTASGRLGSPTLLKAGPEVEILEMRGYIEPYNSPVQGYRLLDSVKRFLMFNITTFAPSPPAL